MLAGVSAESVIVFDALEVAPLRFVWSAGSDNFSQQLQEFRWTVSP